MNCNFSKLICILFILICIFSKESIAQEQWNAHWLGLPASELPDFAVIQARNSFKLETVPRSFTVDLSAVIRYKLYVNGSYVGQGPANNDLKHYTFDSYDIAPYISEGMNVIGLTVFSLGEMNPLRYQDDGLKFIMRTENETWAEMINTGKAPWKVKVNHAYAPTVRGRDFEVISYFAMGGGEKIDGSMYPWDWATIGYDDSDFIEPQRLHTGDSYGYQLSYGRADISLTKRQIPAMNEEKIERPIIRKVISSITNSLENDWKNGTPITIPKNSEVTFLLDQKHLTKGHISYGFSRGKGTKVKVGYAETLFYPDRTQGHRDEIEGKEFIGLCDEYFLDGGLDRTYGQLLPRTWRYIQVHIKTGEEDLIWNSYDAHKFIYPFEEKGSFTSPFKVHQQIWDVGWRTALLCADETYMDCPYYEQLQYLGDTRIQALISLYVSGDDLLMKNAIKQFAHSISNEGITESRYPSSSEQYIPPYSLFLINMLHDFHMHRRDDDFIKSYLYDIAGILYWFENKLQEDDLLGPMPWWSYVDTAPGFKMASPPGFKEGGSIVLTLQYIYAIQEALVLFREYDKEHLIPHFQALSQRMQKSVLDKGWEAHRGLIADTAQKDHFSQHANIFAILSNTLHLEEQKRVFDKIIREDNIAGSNIYFRFYLIRAAQKTGNGDYFIKNLQTWEKMLEEGLTTFAEHENDTRSDCHAWSASPNFEFIHTVAGIQPLEKHFGKVLIAPNPGHLTEFEAYTPHPLGMISVKYTIDENSAEIILPDGLEGIFRWKEKDYLLKEGSQVIKW